MERREVAVIGLPSSGKTTYLAALWHVVTTREITTALRLGRLRAGDGSHLNAITRRWREARVQERTSIGGPKFVSMELIGSTGVSMTVTFPDAPGEAFRRMWEDRDLEASLVDPLKAEGVMLFVHGDTLVAPRWVVEEAAQLRAMGADPPIDAAVAWEPSLAPTQVQLVELLQLLRSPPLDRGPRRLVIVVSAWDKAEEEGLSPTAFIKAKTPLLWQFLRCNRDGWDWTVFGLSAQGGNYDPEDASKPRVAEADALRNLDTASKRIAVVDAQGGRSHDATAPLAWLMGSSSA